MEQKHIAPLTQGLSGRLRIPGDKSVSHRSVMFSALGRTPVRITNFLHAADCLSTVACMKALGAEVEMISDTELVVTGHGLHGLMEPEAILDAGNSGTTLRLLMGLLAPQPFSAVFTGDASLSRRPMGRVIKPLSQMGAKIVGRKGNTLLPITVCDPEAKLHGMTYESPVASAQVKSAILLAGMFADGPTTVVEPVTSRDHTEKMLAAFGVKTEKQGTAVTMHPVADDEYIAPAAIEVPGDISSAAYWLRSCRAVISCSRMSARTRRARASSTCSRRWAPISSVKTCGRAAAKKPATSSSRPRSFTARASART